MQEKHQIRKEKMPKRAKQISFRKCPLTTVIKCHREKPDNVRLILSLPENSLLKIARNQIGAQSKYLRSNERGWWKQQCMQMFYL